MLVANWEVDKLLHRAIVRCDRWLRQDSRQPCLLFVRRCHHGAVTIEGEEEPAELSTNAATAIKAIVIDFTRGVPHNGTLSGQERWSEHLGLAEAAGWQSRLLTHETVSRLVMPLVTRCEYQIGTERTPPISAALRKADRFLAETLGGVNKQRSQELQALVAEDSALTHVEFVISKQWKPIDGACLGALAGELGDLRGTIELAVADRDLNALLAVPLLDAVNWAFRAIAVSTQFGSLIGLGVVVHDVASATRDLVSDVAVQSDRVTDRLTDLALFAVVLDGFAVQLHHAGFVPEWVAQGPGQLSTVAAAAILAKRHDFAEEAQQRWLKLARSMRSDPALPPATGAELAAPE